MVSSFVFVKNANIAGLNLARHSPLISKTSSRAYNPSMFYPLTISSFWDLSSKLSIRLSFNLSSPRVEIRTKSKNLFRDFPAYKSDTVLIVGRVFLSPLRIFSIKVCPSCSRRSYLSLKKMTSLRARVVRVFWFKTMSIFSQIALMVKVWASGEYLTVGLVNSARMP